MGLGWTNPASHFGQQRAFASVCRPRKPSSTTHRGLTPRSAFGAAPHSRGLRTPNLREWVVQASARPAILPGTGYPLRRDSFGCTPLHRCGRCLRPRRRDETFDVRENAQSVRQARARSTPRRRWQVLFRLPLHQRAIARRHRRPVGLVGLHALQSSLEDLASRDRIDGDDPVRAAEEIRIDRGRIGLLQERPSLIQVEAAVVPRGWFHANAMRVRFN
jgi:hypothetical protein